MPSESVWMNCRPAPVKTTLAGACGAAAKVALPAWLAVRLQVPAVSIVTVAFDTVQTAGVVLAKTTGLPEAPPVAATIKMLFATNAIGVAGLKLVIACGDNDADKTTLAGTWVALK